MTELATKSDLPQQTGTGETTVDAARPRSTPTVITEQQVLIGSTAALAGPKVRRNYFAMVRAWFRSDAGHDRARHYPTHHAFIEDALMARMMDRL